MIRVLFIGNSFTNRNDLPGMIGLLAASATPPQKILTERVIANGMALKTHWARGDAVAAIRKTQWDYVVLQEQSTLPLKDRQRMHESIRLFDAEIRSRGAKTLLYLTWARAGEAHRQDELTEAYMSIGRELGATVAPVGVAWQRARRDRLAVELYDRDKSHPNPMGSYVAACVIFAAIFGKSPVGDHRCQGLGRTQRGGAAPSAGSGMGRRAKSNVGDGDCQFGDLGEEAEAWG